VDAKRHGLQRYFRDQTRRDDAPSAAFVPGARRKKRKMDRM
jgi:hypothetical protein